MTDTNVTTNAAAPVTVTNDQPSEERVSLAPLDVATALRALLATPSGGDSDDQA